MIGVPGFEAGSEIVLDLGVFGPAGAVERFFGVGGEIEEIEGAVGVATHKFVLRCADHAQIAVFAETYVVPGGIRPRGGERGEILAGVSALGA